MVTRSSVSVFLIVTGCGLTAERAESAQAAAPNALEREVFLRSGFEAGVTLRAPEVAGKEWEQYLTGADQGFDWGRQLPQRPFPKNRITYLVSSGQKLATYAESRIETVTGRDGQPTKALYMELKKEDASTAPGTRAEFGIYPAASLTQAYARFWLKLQPNLASEILPAGSKKSRQFMEWKETGEPRADFRWGIYIGRDRTFDTLFWFTRAQFGDLQNSPEAWKHYSGVPVPLDQWFLFEVFWKLGVTDGRVWAAVNGQSIIDFTGQTQKDSGLYVWWPFKVYVGTDLASFGGKPLYQWVDDIEFASQPPNP